MLNFSQKGETVNTMIGGVLSILVSLVIYGYFFLKLKEMLYLEQNNISLLQTKVENPQEELG